MTGKNKKTPVGGASEYATASGRSPEGPPKTHRGVDRRTFLQLSALAAAGVPLAELGSGPSAHVQGALLSHLEEATIADLQAAMEAGQLTALQLVEFYLTRIELLDQHGPHLNSILEVNPEASDIARALDEERRIRGPRGPLHGIPLVLKDNIDTADRMMTTAGSLALVGDPPAEDATVVKRLREAGAIILGKTNLSEWANFRSFHSSSGWCGRNGQSRNPYVLDRNPCGSSSGGPIAVSANLCVAALGTETDGSIVCPASACGVVGIKPTVGLTSRAGVVPIAASQDTVGVHARTVADAAAVLGALTGVDPRDPATQASEGRFFTDYTQFLDANGLQGARIGVARQGITGNSEETDAVFEAALQAMREAGATIIDPADIPTIDEINSFESEIVVLVFEFKRDLNAYLATRTGVPIRTLAEAIAFNQAHADQELKFFGQEWFLLAEAEPFDMDTYQNARARARQIGGALGIDAVLQEHDLDALVAPAGSPAWTIDLINGDNFNSFTASSSPAAIAGYPLVCVPAGFSFGLPVGINFMGTAFSEPTLIKLAYAFEQATRVRRPPEFLLTTPLNRTTSRAVRQGRSRPSFRQQLGTRIPRPLLL